MTHRQSLRAEARPQKPRRGSEGWTLVAATSGLAVVQLDVFVVNVAVKQIGTSLGGGTAALQWVVGAYTLLFAALLLTAGALGDRYGAKRMYGLGFITFIAGSVVCGLSPDLGVLVAARAIQGAGAAILGACSLALVNHAFHDEAARARALGIWAAGAAGALSAGPIVGGALIAGISWRAVFFINVPVGGFGLWATHRYASETDRGSRRIDIPGQLAAVVAMAALAGALIEGGSIGFSDPAVVGLLALATVSGIAFYFIETRTVEPLLPLALFRKGPFAGPALLGMVINIAFYGMIFVFSLFFQRQLGYSALVAGLAFAPMTAAVLVTNLSSGRLAAAIGVRTIIVIGLAATTAGCAGLLFIGRHSPFPDMVAQQVLLGAGVGLIVPPMTNTLMTSVDRSRSGIASGTLNTSRQAGSLLGVAVFGSLVATGHFISGLRMALGVSIVLVAAGMLLTIPITTSQRARRNDRATGQ